MDSFKVPLSLPQDLLLIQSLVGVNEAIPLQKRAPSVPIEDDIESSGSEPDSEDEIAAELVGKTEPEPSEPAPQLVSSDESDSDSDSPDDEIVPVKVDEEEVMADEEDSGPSASTSSYFTTKNEVVDPSIVFPDIEQVGPDEYLELVGQVLNIIDNVVIVEGVRTELGRGGSDRALDADTLLVFEDRKVLGYVYETFGPTTQPMYQVKFHSTTYPLDPEKVRVERKVYHVPQRSNFVFMQQIRAMKGSDASNMNDEEPADHELEFSDDEAEAEHRRNLKKKRGSSRASSIAPSSRQSTPAPSQMRDADMANESYFMNNNAYDEIGPYDLNYDAPVSRPAPIPYNDPYADEFEGPSSSSSVAPTSPTSSINDASQLRPPRRSANSGMREDGNRGHGRGRGRGNNNNNSNRGNQSRGGRGGGGGRGRGGGSRGGFDSSGNSNQQAWSHGSSFSGNGVMPGSSDPQQQFYQQPPMSPVGQWPPYHGYGAGMPYSSHQQHQPQQFIQPHINPLFASQFGMGMGVGGPGTIGGGGPYNMPALNMQSHLGAQSPSTPSSPWSIQWHGGGEGQQPGS